MRVGDQAALPPTLSHEGIGQQALAQLEALGVKRTADLGALLCSAGDQSPPVLVVIEGLLRVFDADADGREQTISIVPERQMLNLPAAFDGQGTAPASIQVWSRRATILQIRQCDFVSAVIHDADLALAMLHILSARTRQLTQLVTDLSLRSVRQRLARLLLELVESETNDTQRRWTHAQIATRLGTAREVISRQLRAMVQEGIIQQQRQRLIIMDPQGLRDILEQG